MYGLLCYYLFCCYLFCSLQHLVSFNLFRLYFKKKKIIIDQPPLTPYALNICHGIRICTTDDLFFYFMKICANRTKNFVNFVSEHKMDINFVYFCQVQTLKSIVIWSNSNIKYWLVLFRDQNRYGSKMSKFWTLRQSISVYD